MKTTNPRDFYDALASDYHLIFEDWDASVRRQGAFIHSLLGGHAPHRILDLACGMGTQALGLAQLGHAVTARDLSPALVQRAKIEAGQMGVVLEVVVGDMRRPCPLTTPASRPSSRSTTPFHTWRPTPTSLPLWLLLTQHSGPEVGSWLPSATTTSLSRSGQLATLPDVLAAGTKSGSFFSSGTGTLMVGATSSSTSSSSPMAKEGGRPGHARPVIGPSSGKSWWRLRHGPGSPTRVG